MQPISGSRMQGGRIVWQIMPPWGRDEGVTFSFTDLPTTKREALRAVQSILAAGDLGFLTDRNGVWMIDLDLLRSRFKVPLGGFAWLSGLATLDPDFDVDESEALGRRGLVRIILTPDDLHRPEGPPVPSAKEAPLVFFSYDTRDFVLVELLEKITRSVLGDAVRTFIAKRDIAKGDEARERMLKQALRESSFVMPVCTSRSLGSRWLWFEAGGGFGGGKIILPVCIGVSVGDLPEPLAMYQAAVPEDLHEVFERMARELKRAAPGGVAAEDLASLKAMEGEISARPAPAPPEEGELERLTRERLRAETAVIPSLLSKGRSRESSMPTFNFEIRNAGEKTFRVTSAHARWALTEACRTALLAADPERQIPAHFETVEQPLSLRADGTVAPGTGSLEFAIVVTSQVLAPLLRQVGVEVPPPNAADWIAGEVVVVCENAAGRVAEARASLTLD